jgi:hypothetical protein
MKIKTNFFTEEELDSLLRRVSIDPRIKGTLEIQLENTRTPSIAILSASQLAGACNAEDFCTTAEHAEMHLYGRILTPLEQKNIRMKSKISQILKKFK